MKTTRLFKNGIRALFFVMALMALSLSSCDIYIEDERGYDGDTYLALDYDDVEPSYIEIDNFPRNFKWGESYYVSPGSYQMYYELEYTYHGVNKFKAWEVDYDIWFYEGGRYHDGEDNYFTLYLNIDGADMYRESGWKSTSEENQVPKNYKLLSSSETQRIYEVNGNGVKMKLTYTEVEPKAKK